MRKKKEERVAAVWAEARVLLKHVVVMEVGVELAA
jgi:hypothetical protein